MTTKPLRVSFGQWTPDMPALGAPGVLVARNVLPGPTPEAYYPLPSGVASVAPAGVGDPVIKGYAWANDASRVIHIFAGSSNRLFKLGADLAWDDVSIATNYTAVTGWEFAKFGERIIAVSPESVPQYYDMGTSTLFDDLPGSPPTARCIAVVRDFVVLGDLANYPYRLQWSGFFNSQIWTVGDMANQSDYQDFFGEGGRIQKIIGGEYGLIFQEHSIRRMDYDGPGTVFRFSEIAQAKGTPARGSVIRAGAVTFFYGWDGFCVYDGGNIVNIGDGKVNDWFRKRTAAATLQTKMTVAIDRRRRLVIWSYPANGSSSNNEMLIFNWASQRWSYADRGYETLAEWSSPATSLEDLDTLVGTDIDAFTISLDSDLWKGGDISVAGFDATGAGELFEGTPGTAVIVGPEYGGEGGERLFFSGLRPLADGIENATVSAGLYTRSGFGASPAAPAWRAPNAQGLVCLRVDTRYARPALRIDGDFGNAQGMEMLVRQSGKR